jgi:hypothetical protein
MVNGFVAIGVEPRARRAAVVRPCQVRAIIAATIMLMVLNCVFHFGVRPVMGVADWEAERRLYEVTSRMSPLTWVLLAAGVAATLVFFFRKRR